MDVHENEVQKLDVKKNVEKLNTSELMVQCLESEGVKYIFGIPGEENLT